MSNNWNREQHLLQCICLSLATFKTCWTFYYNLLDINYFELLRNYEKIKKTRRDMLKHLTMDKKQTHIFNNLNGGNKMRYSTSCAQREKSKLKNA